MFTAASLTIPKIRKQPNDSSTDELIKKIWCVYTCIYTYIHTMEYYSVIQKNEIMPFAVIWMVLGITILSEIGQKEKDKCHIMSFMVTKNIIQINLFTKQI